MGMNDREKIINAIEKAKKQSMEYAQDRIIVPFKEADMILALLKEQEAIEPRRIDGKRNHFIKCGNCNYDLLTGYMFCPHCGKAVKLDA